MSHISLGNIWNIQRSYWGSSCSLMFFKIGEKLRKIHRKHLRWSLFLIKLQTLFITEKLQWRCVAISKTTSSWSCMVYKLDLASVCLISSSNFMFKIRSTNLKKKEKEKAWHLFKYISKHTKTALNYKEHLRTTAAFYLEIFPVFPIFPKRNNFTDFFHANGR